MKFALLYYFFSVAAMKIFKSEETIKGNQTRKIRVINKNKVLKAASKAVKINEVLNWAHKMILLRFPIQSWNQYNTNLDGNNYRK